MPIGYLNETIKAEFAGIHPAVKSVITQLQAYCESASLPDVMITHAWRSFAAQKLMYHTVAVNIIKKLEREDTLTDEEHRMLGLVEGIAKAQKISLEKAFERWVDNKFSWHMAHCAVDIRNRHYNHGQRQAVMAFLMSKISRGEWELLEHDIGRGDHIHIAKKDFEWKTKHAV